MEDDTCSIIRDILSTNNVNMIIDIKNQIDDIIQALYDNSKNKIAIRSLKQITKEMDSIIKNINDNSDKLNVNNICDTNNQINHINNNKTIKNEFDELVKKKIPGIKNYYYGEYFGEIKNETAEGKGIIYLKNGNVYNGDWKNDKADGLGICIYINGSKYEGNFKNNVKDGKGVYYYPDGNIYFGEWKNDKKDGKGAIYWNNGDREIGDFKNGRRIGIFAKLCKNGEVKKIEY